MRTQIPKLAICSLLITNYPSGGWLTADLKEVEFAIDKLLVELR